MGVVDLLHMEITTTTTTGPNRRQATITALAGVGFVALLLVGIMLAIYSARFVPKTVSRLGAAAVSLSSIFTPADNAQLEVVPVATTTTAIVSTTATSTATSPGLVATNLGNTPASTGVTTAGAQTTATFPIGGTVTPVLSGKSDLYVTITQVGYLKNSDSSSFVATTNIPDGENVAAKFTVINIGTNATGSWSFEARIPTSSSYKFNSPVQQSLLPNERIEYVLGFDRAQTGTNKTITITVDDDNNVSESNENNNSDTATVTIN